MDRTSVLSPDSSPPDRPSVLRRRHQCGASRQGVLARLRQSRRLKWFGIAALSLLLVGVLVLVWAWNATPSVSGLSDWVRAQDAAHHAPYTPLAQISSLEQEALIAIEDERFYQHHGIDIIGLLRAAWDDLRAGRAVEGGSTLTAQLAKNAYLHGYDHTLPLKLEDLLLAVKIEQRYRKGQILELYFNLVYFGEDAYGIGVAASRYFGVSPARLDLAQAALLAGLVRAPGAYDPWCHPSAARGRQQTVLARMVADGYISAAQARAAGREVFAFWLPGAAPRPDRDCT